MQAKGQGTLNNMFKVFNQDLSLEEPLPDNDRYQ